MGLEASKPKADRRFATLDAMILVAALAAGFGVLRASSPEADWASLLGRGTLLLDRPRGETGDIASGLVAFATPPAVALTVAVLAIRLRRPRPAWRRLVRRPGTMACLAPAPAWATAMLFAAAAVSRGDGDRWPGSPGLWIEVYSLAASILGGFAVAVAWATLALARRWRPEPSWLDRLGRLVGVGWIALAVLAGYSLFWQTI